MPMSLTCTVGISHHIFRKLRSISKQTQPRSFHQVQTSQAVWSRVHRRPADSIGQSSRLAQPQQQVPVALPKIKSGFRYDPDRLRSCRIIRSCLRCRETTTPHPLSWMQEPVLQAYGGCRRVPSYVRPISHSTKSIPHGCGCKEQQAGHRPARVFT